MVFLIFLRYSLTGCPLISGNFFIKNILKTKNGLRIICRAPHLLASQVASPQGEATKWLNIFAEENEVH